MASVVITPNGDNYFKVMTQEIKQSRDGGAEWIGEKFSADLYLPGFSSFDKGFQINWAGCGSQNIEDTEEFIAVLQAAVDLAKRLRTEVKA